MTPYEIKILLIINSSTSWRDNIEVATIGDLWYETISNFKTLGLVGPDDQRTERLKVYCDALLDLPLPVPKWVMP